MITFRECSEKGYSPRTKVNANADTTLAFAADFDSAGERLTHKYCIQQGRRIYRILAEFGKLDHNIINKIQAFLTTKTEFELNIAGNGIYTMHKHGWTQKDCDDFARLYIANILKNKYHSCRLIRSGGQTGFDESGIKAALILGIPALVYAPKGWMFRDVMGTDHCDEVAFKARFFNQQTL